MKNNSDTDNILLAMWIRNLIKDLRAYISPVYGCASQIYKHFERNGIPKEDLEALKRVEEHLKEILKRLYDLDKRLKEAKEETIDREYYQKIFDESFTTWEYELTSLINLVEQGLNGFSLVNTSEITFFLDLLKEVCQKQIQKASLVRPDFSQCSSPEFKDFLREMFGQFLSS